MSGEIDEAIKFDLKYHQTANRFLLTLGALLHQADIYEADNQTLKELFDRLLRDLKDVFALQPFFKFRSQDQNIFINEERLRSDGATFLQHQQMLRALAARKIGGMAFHVQPALTEWQGVITLITRSKPDTPSPFQDLRQSLQEYGLWDKVELLPEQGQVRLVNLRQYEEKRTTAVRAYAKALSLFRLYMENLDDSVHLSYYHLKLYRAIQDFATMCQEGGWKYLGLVNNKAVEEYRYSHPTSVALLSMILGARLKLRRTRLGELGMTAVLHDLGKSRLPRTLMEKSGPFTPEERLTFNQHPTLATKTLLRARQYNESLLKRITVLNEHHRAARPGEELHPYSRIIAVAENFDALASSRPGRAALRPDEAVKQLIGLAGKRLDRDVVYLFVQTIGFYPSGTLLELSTGEKAVSGAPNPDPFKWRTPVVRIIPDANGNETKPLLEIDLADENLQPRRTIVRTLDPEEHNINVSGYLYSEVKAESLTGDSHD